MNDPGTERALDTNQSELIVSSALERVLAGMKMYDLRSPDP
jgi:hypothetical protein